MQHFSAGATRHNAVVLAACFSLVLTALVTCGLAIDPAGRTPGKILVAAMVLTVVLAVVDYHVLAAKITIDGDALKLGAGFYKITCLTSEIELETDKPRSIRDMGVTLRVNGIFMPWFRLGWFRLRTGRRVFVFARTDRAVYLRTSRKFDVIVSINEAELADFRSALRAAA